MRIVCTILRRDGSPVIGEVRFRPTTLDAVTSGSNMLSAGDETFSLDDDGELDCTLQTGIYLVFIPETKQFKIQVLDSVDTINLAALSISDLPDGVDFVWTPPTLPLHTPGAMDHEQLVYNATMILDFDDAANQSVVLAGSVDFATTSRAADDTRLNRILLRVDSGNASRTITWATGIAFDGPTPSTIGPNETRYFEVLSYGPDEDDTFVSANPGLIETLRGWANNWDRLLTNMTVDADGLLATADINWPDRKAGVFTTTATDTDVYEVKAFTMTHVTGSVTITITQAAITFDGDGNITSKPELTFS